MVMKKDLQDHVQQAMIHDLIRNKGNCSLRDHGKGWAGLICYFHWRENIFYGEGGCGDCAYIVL
jgi:hypothetical protein